MHGSIKPAVLFLDNQGRFIYINRKEECPNYQLQSIKILPGMGDAWYVCSQLDWTTMEKRVQRDSGMYLSTSEHNLYLTKRELQLYSGAYKYLIGQQLVGAEEILKQMGYTLDVELDRLIVLGMLDYDRLVLVSRDCLLAKVESQVHLLIFF